MASASEESSMAQVRRNLLPIGIHLNSDAVYMAQLEQSSQGVKVVSKAACRLSTSAETVARVTAANGDGGGQAGNRSNEATYGRACRFIRQKIATNGFQGKNVVVSLPQEYLTIQHVRMQPMQPEELKTALPGELRGHLSYDPKDAIVRHIVAGAVSENNETKHDVLILAAPRHVVEKHISAMTRLGLQVAGVGIEPCAMCYCFAYAASRTGPSQSGPPCAMVVYLGPRTTHVAILRGQGTTFVKGVEQGTDRLIGDVATVRSVPLEEAANLIETWRQSPTPETLDEAAQAYSRSPSTLDHLTDEIESCVRYHESLTRGAGVDRLYLVGPGARDRALVRVLSGRLHVPCKVGDPFGVVMGKADPESTEPEMAVAVGLSLFGVQ
jgi:type IV pilus assembly protein PilM